MSLFSYPFGREAPINKIITTSVSTTVYTAGNNGATIVGLRLLEAANTSVQTATLTVSNSATSVSAFTFQRAFAVKETYDAVTLAGVPIVLYPNASLMIALGGATSVHVTGVVIEPDQRG